MKNNWILPLKITDCAWKVTERKYLDNFFTRLKQTSVVLYDDIKTFEKKLNKK